VLRQTKVRLAEIDTPESRQPYGNRAKQALSALVLGKEVRVMVVDTDRYGRTVGRTGRERRDGPSGRGLGVSEIQPRSIAAPPGAGGTIGATRPMGAAGNGAHAPVGVAACSQSEPHVDNARSSVIVRVSVQR
jgi:hypothetical protein